MSPVPHRRALAAAAVFAAALACGAPRQTAAPVSPPSPADTTPQVAEVVATRREVRVVFPAEAPERWRTKASGLFPGDSADRWGLLLGGGGEPRTVWAALADTAEVGRAEPRLLVGVCRPGMVANCTEAGVAAWVEDGRVVLALRDSATVADVLGLRPPTADVYRIRPGAPYQPPGSITIRYAEPQIPEPDSATRAGIAARRRAYEASIRRVSRRLRGTARGQRDDELWAAVGDTVRVAAYETDCTFDVCSSGEIARPDLAWTVAGGGVARLLAPDSITAPAGRRRRAPSTAAAYVVAQRVGRARISVAGMGSTRDTMPSRRRLPTELSATLVVTPRPARVRISPRPAALPADTLAVFRVTVRDAQGRPIRGAPASVDVSGGGERWGQAASDSFRLSPRAPGPYVLVASYGTVADTLALTVRAPEP